MAAPTPHKRGNAASDRVDTSLEARQQAIAAESVNEDMQREGGDVTGTSPQALQRTASLGYSMSGSYRRPSYVATGATRSTFLPAVQQPERGYLTKDEEEAVREDERSLLRDNKILLPKHPRRSSAVSNSMTRSLIANLRRKSKPDEEATIDSAIADGPSETTPLIPGADPTLPYGGQDSPEELDAKWDEAVTAGKISTTWQREAKVLARYSRSLVLTFFLQYSLTVCSVFAVGHIGKLELGAVSLGSMTTNITGYAVLQGLATSLDTLCAQAYGSGQHKLVGLQTLRMILFLWVVLIPIAAIWLSGARILSKIVPERETAELAGLYLKITLIGTPGYAAFEAGKRFVQAQGLFTANLYVLLIVAPLNAFMHWLFVWHFGWGFIGAPISVAITELLMPILLFFYIYFINGRECWGGFSTAAFRNWWPMIRLALPGLVMVLAEYLAFEILTFGASWISSSHLAAQSVLSTILVLTYQIPFPISVAASTRIANLIGATLAPAARTAANVALVAAVFVGLLNMIVLSSLRNYIPVLFTNDKSVSDLVAQTLPLCAAFQLFDAVAANCNGILRGIGRQEFGGYVSLAAYYGIAMPLSFGLGFGLKWGLLGLWTGPAIALAL